MEARRAGSRRRKGWAAAGPQRPGRSDWRTAGGARGVNPVQNVGGRPVQGVWGTEVPQ